jgi:hypothetical protein
MSLDFISKTIWTLSQKDKSLVQRDGSRFNLDEYCWNIDVNEAHTPMSFPNKKIENLNGLITS